MADIFDEVEGQQGDIFDQISPSVQGDVESPNFGKMAKQALASGPSSFGRGIAPAANYYGNEVPSGAIRSMVAGKGMAGAQSPERFQPFQSQMIDAANRAMDVMGVNKLPNQNVLPPWMGHQFNPQVAARFAGGVVPSTVGVAADMLSRPADTLAMMALGLPTGQGLVGAQRSIPAIEGYGEMFNVAPQLKNMNVMDRITQALPFLNHKIGGKGNTVEQMIQNNRRQAPLAEEAYKNTSEILPVNEKVGGYEQKMTGQKYPEQTRITAEEITPTKDYSQLTQGLQGKQKVLWDTIVKRLTGKQNLDKRRFAMDIKDNLMRFRAREMGRAGYTPSDEKIIKDTIERFFRGVMEQEQKTGKYDMLDALMDKRTENELTARLRKMQQTGQNLGTISAEKIAHEAIREALLRQVTEADPVAGQLARRWGNLEESSTKASELSQRESNTVKGGIDPASVIANPKGSAMKAVTDKIFHRDMGARTAKIAENMKKIQQLKAENEAIMGKFKSSPAYSGPVGKGAPEKGALPQQQGPKLLEKQFESRPAPKQLGAQPFEHKAEEGVLRPQTSQLAEKARLKGKGSESLIGKRTLENQAEIDAGKKYRSVGAAGAGTLSEEPAVMAPPRAAEGRAPRSTTHTEVMREEAPQNEKILQDIDWGNMTSRNPLIERLQEFKDDGTPLGKHLAEQAKALIKEIYRGEDPEAGATAREFIRSNAGVLDQKAGAHMSKGIASKSSEAPLSESKTIREGNPAVTDVGDKSVGAMEVKIANAKEAEASEWEKVYKDAKPITASAMKYEAEGAGNKIEGVPIISLTKGCQRCKWLDMNQAGGVVSKEALNKACYGDCWTNASFHVRQGIKSGRLKAMQEKELQMANPKTIDMFWKNPKNVDFVDSEKIPFIRHGQKGDDSHAFRSGLVKSWEQAKTNSGVKKPDVFISASYAPVPKEIYQELVPYKDKFVIHFSNSGWFEKGEILNRLNEFQKAKDSGMNAYIRLITNRSGIKNVNGEVPSMANEQWLIDEIRKRGLENDVLETPFHNDVSKQRSKASGEFKNVCCETGQCATCGVKCMVKQIKKELKK